MMTFIQIIGNSLNGLDREIKGVLYRFKTTMVEYDKGSIYIYPSVTENDLEVAKFHLIDITSNGQDITLKLNNYKNSTFENTMLVLEHVQGPRYQFVSPNREVIIPFDLKG